MLRTSFLVLALAIAFPAQAAPRSVDWRLRAAGTGVTKFDLTRAAGGIVPSVETSPYVDRAALARALAAPARRPTARVDADGCLRPNPTARLCASADGLSLSVPEGHALHGLGEQFLESRFGDPDGDWRGERRTPGDAHGNQMTKFRGGATGNAMFPVLYVVAPSGRGFALFLDHVEPQTWDLTATKGRVEIALKAATIRGYWIEGASPTELRSRFLELVGRPTVPPRKAFGLWVSEYGFDDWAELREKLRSLRAGGFPVDGFMLDLQWFGGIREKSPESRMGSLTFDEAKFPKPAEEIRRLREIDRVGVIPIEEPYIAGALPEHADLEARGFLARASADGSAHLVNENPWWGLGGLLDFTNPAASAYWHATKRRPLAEMGVLGHWTDLGEPEAYHQQPGDRTPWYHGLGGGHAQADIQNAYGFLWAKSIADGYARDGSSARPLILARTGGPGIQRFGAALWSGDIGANLGSLAAHAFTQAEMSWSGVDYFGSDIGGFWRPETYVAEDRHDLYTRWFAASAAMDVPLRPHTFNLDNRYETAPDREGIAASNLANLRARYELLPYYYSLAHRAARAGEPVFPPLSFAYPGDPVARRLNRQKLIGRDVMVALSLRAGEEALDVYLPRGRWYDESARPRARRWIESRGDEWLRGVSLRAPDGTLRLPRYVRAGAILPVMEVDARTLDVWGARADGTRSSDQLALRVYPGTGRSRFDLYEDDGETIAYAREGAVVVTPISQTRLPGGGVRVNVGSKRTAARSLRLDVAWEGAAPSRVRLDGKKLPWTLVAGFVRIEASLPKARAVQVEIAR